jgi:predicted HAD superfamily Cof-like phosphohydrolase
MDAQALRYALAKQVPEMRYGLTLETTYGSLVLVGTDAAQVAELVEKLLRAKLKRSEREEGKR